MSPCCILLLALPLAASQSFGMGRCPNPAVQANFSMEKFLGRWYDIQTMLPMKEEGRCSESNMVWQDDNSVLVTISHKPDQRKKLVLYPGTKESAKLEFCYQTNNEYLNAFMPRSHVWVLKTDYSHMAMLYSCMGFLDMFYFEFAWIVSRERTLPSQVVREAMAVLQREDIDVDSMVEVDQTNCD